MLLKKKVVKNINEAKELLIEIVLDILLLQKESE